VRAALQFRGIELQLLDADPDDLQHVSSSSVGGVPTPQSLLLNSLKHAD
jgi:hypothetical protein